MYLELWLYVKVFADRSISMRGDGGSNLPDHDIHMSCFTLTVGLIVVSLVQPARRPEERATSSNGSAGVGSRPSQAQTATLPRPWQGCQKAYHILAQNMTSRRGCPTPHRANDSAHIGRHLCSAILSKHHGPSLESSRPCSHGICLYGVVISQLKKHNFIDTWVKNIITLVS